MVNNTGRRLVATRAATELRRDGWTVASLALYSGGILSSCVYYDPADPANKGAATSLMQAYPSIRRTKARFDGLPTGPLVLVLTRDLV